MTNVTRFGAFVDVGVHQDGLVHISELDNRFVQDPSDVVSVGDVVRVKVLEVDLARRRHRPFTQAGVMLDSNTGGILDSAVRPYNQELDSPYPHFRQSEEACHVEEQDSDRRR